MEQNMISKKELLDLTGISYGQLYRWKRKNLIPEEWFIRKSTFTGQETFFPRDKILARIDKIKNMKEDLSLDDLAEVFSSNPVEVVLTKEEIIKQNIVTPMVLDVFGGEQFSVGDVIPFQAMLFLYVLDKMLQTGEISLDEGAVVHQTLKDNYVSFAEGGCELFFIRKLGIATCCLASSPCQVCFDKDTRVVARLNLASCIEELKIKINGGMRGGK